MRALALLARRYDIGLNIDAEEADRLELSLDLLEALCFDPDLAGWNGIGFVVQGYQALPFVIDYLIDLARRSRHRLMIRLVKGAYWDTEIKRAQVDGLEGYPVYAQDLPTCRTSRARKAARGAGRRVPAVRDAQRVHAGRDLPARGPELLPGPVRIPVPARDGRLSAVRGHRPRQAEPPCRVYAPVGTRDAARVWCAACSSSARTSFVNRIADKTVSVKELVADPVDEASKVVPLGARAKIPLPRNLYGDERPSSMGLDLSNEHRLASLSSALLARCAFPWRAAPMLADDTLADAPARDVRNPADQRSLVGTVSEATAGLRERGARARGGRRADLAGDAGRCACRLPGARGRPARSADAR